MKIGIDVDEVLCRTNDYFLYEFNKKNKTKFKREELTKYDYNCFKGYSGTEIFKALVKHLDENLIYYDIFDGSKNYLIKLKKEGHELYIITSRWLILKDKTITWLESHFGKGFFKEILIYNDESEKISKVTIAKKYNIEILIDDAPKFAIGAAKEKIKVLLMDHPWNKLVKENKFITRVHSWKEIYENIKKIQEERNNKKEKNKNNIKLKSKNNTI